MYIAHRMSFPLYDLLRLGMLSGLNHGWLTNTK